MGESESVLRAALDVANRHDLDRFFTYVADDVKFVNPVTGPTDKTGMRGFHDAFFTAFPDIHYRIDRLITSGDSVIVEITVTGTNTGAFMGMPPTKKPVEITLAFAVDTKNGKISEWHSYFDQVALQKQLGILPEAVPA
ncbi:MAG TPA: ester cyclase [Candidatus Limnocylindria bacterium]|nr:ester cyclase [Candidatus Limnocylindria bacterium]